MANSTVCQSKWSLSDFNCRNKAPTAKLLRQGYRYFKLRKAFSKFYRRHSALVEKYNVDPKTLLEQNISEREFYGELVYRFRKIVGKSNFSKQFRSMRIVTVMVHRKWDRLIIYWHALIPNSLMLPTKFQVNWPFDSEEAKNRFSRWPPWWQSWISYLNDFSYFLFTNHPDAFYQVSSELTFLFRRRSKKQIFKLVATAAILDFWSEQFYLFLIYKSPWCFVPSFKSISPGV